MDTFMETALDGIGGNPLPRFGTSRRSQQKRSLHARGQGSLQQQSAPAVVTAPPLAKRPRLKVVPRRASTAPSYKASGQTEQGDTFDTAANTCGSPIAKASSCPPLKEGLSAVAPCDSEEGAPLTPRILALPPSAAVPAASKSPPPPSSREPSPQDIFSAAAASPSPSPAEAVSVETQSPPQSQASGSASAAAAAVADTTETAVSATTAAVAVPMEMTASAFAGMPAVPPASSSGELSFPRLPPISAPTALALLVPRSGFQMGTSPPTRGGRTSKSSSPGTPTVATPPPETPRGGAGSTTSASGLRGSRGGKQQASCAAAAAASVKNRASAGEHRAGGYQGRFCGRLYLKEDEVKLAAECQLLGPLLGSAAEGGAREGDPGRHTLAKIVRGFASGAVREHCQERERQIKVLEAQLAAQQAASQEQLAAMAAENRALRAEVRQLTAGRAAAAACLPLLPGSSTGTARAPTAAAVAAASLAAAKAQASLAQNTPLAVLSAVPPMSPALQRVLAKPPPPRFPAVSAVSHPTGSELTAFTSVALPASLPVSPFLFTAGPVTPTQPQTPGVASTAATPKLSLSAPSLAASSLAGLTVSCSSTGPMPTGDASGFSGGHLLRGPATSPMSIAALSTTSGGDQGLSARSVESVAGGSMFSAFDPAPAGSTPPATHPTAPAPAALHQQQQQPQMSLQNHLAQQRVAFAAAQVHHGFVAPPPQQQQQQRQPTSPWSGPTVPQSLAVSPFVGPHRSAFHPVPQRGTPAGIARPMPSVGVPPVALPMQRAA